MNKYKIELSGNKPYKEILSEVTSLMDKGPTYVMNEEEQAIMNMPFTLLQQDRNPNTIEAGKYYLEVDEINQRRSLLITSFSESVAFNTMTIEDGIIYDISLYYHPRSKTFFYSSNDSYVAEGNTVGSTYRSAKYDSTDKKKYIDTIFYINEVDLATSLTRLLKEIKNNEYLYNILSQKYNLEDIVSGINSKLKLKDKGIDLNKGNVR